MSALDKLKVLVIEANQGMRAQLRTMLEGFRITGVQFAPTAGSAVRKLRESGFDVIFCDHDLGEGQDGQHLLEDLRSRAIIPRRTLFIMITSERNYERVIGTAELSPDDYILKPLTASTLQQRLERALNRREVFMPLYRALDSGDSAAALSYCQQAEHQHPRYHIDFMRERAELLATLGQFSEAQHVFEAILAEKPVPWARLGLARMHFAQQRYHEAEPLLQDLVKENAYFLAAYDWLARTRQQTGDIAQARAVLSEAVDMSPHRIGRLRTYAAVSMDAGDFESAESTLTEVVRKGKYSDFRVPEDHVALVRAQLARGRVEEAEATARDLDKSMPGVPEASVCSALTRALIHKARNDHDKARQAVLDALAAGAGNADLSRELKQQLVEACLANRLDAEGSELVADMLRTAEDVHSLESSRAVLRKHGRDDLADAVEQKIHAEVKNVVARGAQKAQAGDFDGAVQEMMGAVRKLPGNPHVLLNATLALLRHIEHKGWNERFADQARMLINRTRKLDPDNSRLEALTQFMQNLARKYGVRADRATAPQEPERPPNPGIAWMR